MSRDTHLFPYQGTLLVNLDYASGILRETLFLQRPLRNRLTIHIHLLPLVADPLHQSFVQIQDKPIVKII